MTHIATDLWPGNWYDGARYRCYIAVNIRINFETLSHQPDDAVFSDPTCRRHQKRMKVPDWWHERIIDTHRWQLAVGKFCGVFWVCSDPFSLPISQKRCGCSTQVCSLFGMITKKSLDEQATDELYTFSRGLPHRDSQMVIEMVPLFFSVYLKMGTLRRILLKGTVHWDNCDDYGEFNSVAIRIRSIHKRTQRSNHCIR